MFAITVNRSSRGTFLTGPATYKCMNSNESAANGQVKVTRLSLPILDEIRRRDRVSGPKKRIDDETSERSFRNSYENRLNHRNQRDVLLTTVTCLERRDRANRLLCHYFHSSTHRADYNQMIVIDIPRHPLQTYYCNLHVSPWRREARYLIGGKLAPPIRSIVEIELEFRYKIGPH